MEPGFVELLRCRDGTILDETRAMLDAAEVSYRVGSTATNFDLSSIGSGSNAEAIITVRRADYESARSALESEYLKVDLPEDHHLRTVTDAELAEILGKTSEWSPFDVAHARRIAKERGISEEDIQEQEEERMNKLRTGKPAPEYLLITGWVFSVLGGLIGLGIAWSICFMKEKTPEGEFFSYDAESREKGKLMLAVASIVLAIALVIKLREFLYGVL